MERTRPDEEINSTLSKEKSRKTKRFIYFLSEYADRQKPDSDSNESKLESKIDFLEIVREYIDSKSNEDLEDVRDDLEMDSEPIDVNEFEKAKLYINESLQLNTDAISRENLNKSALNYRQINILILSKVKDCLDNQNDIDIEQIVLQSSLELNQDSRQQTESTTEQKSKEMHKESASAQKNKLKGEELKNTKQVTGLDPKKKFRDKVSEITIDKESGDLTYVSNNSTGTNDRNPPVETSAINLLNSNESTNRLSETPKSKLKNEVLRRPLIKPSDRQMDLKPESVNLIEKPKDRSPSRKITPEKTSPYFINESKYTPSDIEILRKAEKVFVDRVSLRKFYENSDLSIVDLRKILSIKNKQKKYGGPLKRALERRHNNYSEILSNIKRRPNLNVTTSSANLSSQSLNRSDAINDNKKPKRNSSEANSVQSKQRYENRQTMPLLTILVLIIVFIIFIIGLILLLHK